LATPDWAYLVHPGLAADEALARLRGLAPEAAFWAAFAPV